jgi:curved DNA-binding protein CbpA
LEDHSGYYKILGVSEKASYYDIRRAYRRLVKKYHPDRNGSSLSEDMIRMINAAFEVLSDKDKRKHYDITGQSQRSDTTTQSTVAAQDSGQSHESFKRTDRPENRYDYKSYSKRTDHQRTSDFEFRTRMHERYRDRESPGFRKETIKMEESSVNEASSKTSARFHIIVEPSLCMAFGSCEILAPKVFVLEKNKKINPKVKIESEDGASSDEILAAAETCPTKAIKIIDRYSGEQIYP